MLDMKDVFASARPFRADWEPSVIVVSANICPTKKLLIPSAAVLPTDQNTLEACALFFKITVECADVVNVDGTLKIHADFVTFRASKTSTPHSAIVAVAEVEQYTPGKRTKLDNSVAK